MSKTTSALRWVAIATSLTLAGCVTPGGGTISTGTAPTAATGAAGGASSVNANPTLERCDAPLGTLAVDDGRGKEWYASFGAATKITTIEPLIRLAVQQSNCFVITSVGNNRTESKMSAITDKQRNSGEFRAGSKQQKGQRVAADYYMEPSIIIDNDATGQLAAGVGGLFGSVGALVGGAMQSKASVVTLSMFDIRSGVQISISEGNATATNFGAAWAAWAAALRPVWAASRARRKARPPWPPSWMPTTTWWCRCATTRRRKSRAAWAAAAS
jgi:hypothetical protein